MKSAAFFVSILAAALFGGCTVAEQSAEDIGTQFQQGIQGRGRIVPNDPTTDAFGSEYN